MQIFKETHMEELLKENAMLKIALCKMIDQFMYRTNANGAECFDNYCESAGEWAFKALGLKGRHVRVDEILATEEQEGEKLLEINKKARS